MNKKGVTLLELVLAMGMSAILIAAIYRGVWHQQHTYYVQEQVADTQQNVRTGLNRLTREIRMAGYGDVDAFFESGPTWRSNGSAKTFSHIVTPGATDDEVTVVAAFEQVATLTSFNPATPTIVVLDSAAACSPQGDDKGRQYICFNGEETRRIQAIAGNQLTLNSPLNEVYAANDPVYRVVAVRYYLANEGGRQVLFRDRNMDGTTPEVVSENINSLEFLYLMNGDSTLRHGSELTDNRNLNDPLSFINIRAVQINLVAQTDQPDSEMPGTGRRTRTLNSLIQLRNLTANPGAGLPPS